MARHRCLQEMGRRLACRARYLYFWHLRNCSPGSTIGERISIQLHSIEKAVSLPGKVDPNNGHRSRRTYQRRPISMLAGGVPVLRGGQAVAIEVQNQSSDPLFFDVVLFGSDFSICPLSCWEDNAGNRAFQCQRKRVACGRSQWLGWDAHCAPVQLASHTGCDGKETRHGLIKVFACVEEMDFAFLAQPGLDSKHHPCRLTKVGEQWMFSGWRRQKRRPGVRRLKDPADWSTTELRYIVGSSPTPKSSERHGSESG
ncbi:MAG: hypothetical protein MI861_00765, partial [Pirellulales bacterium]|nr:hypothetical protein [Pirellulales bacterium]